MNNTQQPQQKIEAIKREILLGLTNDNEALILEIDTTRNYFSMGRTNLDMNDILTEETGTERAREYLEDGELWRMAVADERTEDSLEDFNEQVINMDGWEGVLGDIYQIDYDRYVRWSSCGQGKEDLHKMKKLLITKKELAFLIKCWDKYHLVNFDTHKRLYDPVDINDKDIENMNKCVEIFKKYPEFDYGQLAQFLKEGSTELLDELM